MKLLSLLQREDSVDYPLQVLASDGRTDLYARALLYNAVSGAPVGTVPLPHLAGGLYSFFYTFSVPGRYTVVYQLFLDSGFTSPALYDKEVELVENEEALLDALITDHLLSGSVGEALAIIRGMVQHNFVLDNIVYNTKGLLTSARIRIFRTKADTNSQTNPISTFLVTASPRPSPNDVLPQFYKVTQE